MNSTKNIFNKSHRNTLSGGTENKIQKLISPVKNDLNVKTESNLSEGRNPEKDTLEKIIYIQKWWKFMKKVILIQKKMRCFLRRKKTINVVYLMKMIYKLYFKKLIERIKLKIKKGENNKNYLNDVNKNIKNNFIKKIKKYEKSTKINKKERSKNNSLFFNSKGNKYLFTKKLEEPKRTRNEKLKSFNSSNGLIDSMNINKENTKYFMLNDSNNNIYKTQRNKEKEINKSKNNIFSQEKLNAYNNIFNLYNNIKKMYKNSPKNICETIYSTTNDFYNKNNFFKFNDNKENKTTKNKKGINKNIIINKNNNINVNININDIQKKENNIKYFPKIDSSCMLKIDILRKLFLFWKEFSTKKNIIKELKKTKVKKSFENELNIFKNRLKDKKIKKKNDPISINKNKLNFSNSISEQRLTHIKKMNQKKKENLNNKQCIYNFKEKKAKASDIKKNEKRVDNKKIFSKDKNFPTVPHKGNFNFNKVNKKLPLPLKNEEEKNDLIKLLERLVDIFQIKKCFNRWKLIIRAKNNSKGIEEKIINFRPKKSPFKVLNNSTFNIFNKKGNFNKGSQEYFCQTESNINMPYSHIRSNSIGFQKNIVLSSLNCSNEKLNKVYIKKPNMNSPTIVYKKKLLIDGMKGKKIDNNIDNLDKGTNFTVNASSIYSDILNKTEGNFFRYKENKNSIYGGKFNKGYNTIEEREICFTPNKNSTFKNNFGININVVENYLNGETDRNEIENYNIKNLGIKTKQIYFGEKNKI